MTDDGRLLEQWKRQGSQAAFSALVTRHLDFVYSVCLRETQDAALAEDTTQVVFLLLSRKAPAFGPDTRLTGWLFQTARFACKNARRRDASRRRHEQKIGEQMLSESLGQDALWEQMAPHLNAALTSLGAKDREAVLLRFADGLSFSELGTALGTSEDAARMRVSRALTRLRGFFAKQGVSVTTLVLTGLLADRTTQAAPASCAISLGSLGASALSPQISAQLQGVLKTMTLNKLKLAAPLGAAAVLAGAIPFVTLAHSQGSGLASETRQALKPAAPLPSINSFVLPGTKPANWTGSGTTDTVKILSYTSSASYERICQFYAKQFLSRDYKALGALGVAGDKSDQHGYALHQQRGSRSSLFYRYTPTYSVSATIVQGADTGEAEVTLLYEAKQPGAQ